MPHPLNYISPISITDKTYPIAHLAYSLCRLKESYDEALATLPIMARPSRDSRSQPESPSSASPDRIHPLRFNILMLAELILNTPLGDTRIHTGPEANKMTRQAGADALTSGNKIYFREGKYQPDSEEGKNLLIHELQHVAQFKEGRLPETDEDRGALEAEAAAREQDAAGQEFHNMTPEKSRGLSFPEPAPQYIRIITNCGREYLLTEEELEEVKQRVVEEFTKHIEENWLLWGYEEKAALMEKLFSER
ncbi:MAG: DUF4157 domain-containing protein [Spirochaetales bacterium]|nr:DUF4157 domain-containing protein [Spirochaetales bacterium]